MKGQSKNWPRLLETMDYCPFLQEEFTDDYSVSNDSDLYEDSPHGCQKSTQNSFRKLRPKNFGRRKKQSITPEEIKRIYLFLYNLFQFVGFIYVLVVLSIRFAKEGAGRYLKPSFSLELKKLTFFYHFLDSTHGSYKTLGIVIKLLYLTQIQEVVYYAVDSTRKGSLFLLLHLAFRHFIVFVMIDSEPRIQTQLVVFNLLLIYTLMELIKYPYYMLRSFNVSIGFLTWIRCTTCLLLYPLSFLCEGVIMFKNLAYFEETERYSLYLPNQLNFSFHLPSFIRCYLLLGLFPCKCNRLKNLLPILRSHPKLSKFSLPFSSLLDHCSSLLLSTEHPDEKTGPPVQNRLTLLIVSDASPVIALLRGLMMENRIYLNPVLIEMILKFEIEL